MAVLGHHRGPHPQASANACSCKASHQTFCTKGPSWIWSVLPTTVYTTQRTMGWQIHWRNLSQAPLWSMWTIMANVLPLQMDPAQNANSCLPRHSAWYIIHTVPQKRNWCWQTFWEQDTICMILKLPQKKTFLMLMQMKCTSAVETSPQLEWRLFWRNTSAIHTAPWWFTLAAACLRWLTTISSDTLLCSLASPLKTNHHARNAFFIIIQDILLYYMKL